VAAAFHEVESVFKKSIAAGSIQSTGVARMARLAKHGISAVAYAVHMAAKSASVRRMLFNSIRLNRPETERFRSIEECGFLAYIFLNRPESKAQILQDLWVSYELGEKRDGFFVEFGATNGLVNSNTWLLEKKYGWKGILAEPNPVWHAMLAANRGATIDHRCVGATSRKTVTFLTTDASDPELSSIAEFAGGDHFAEVRAKGNAIQVETVSLSDLLIQHQAPVEIDYMSIDTEGSEFAILSQFDFSRYVVNLMSVEQNRHTEAKIEALLKKQGFDRVVQEFSQWDGWYVRTELRRQGSRFGMDAISHIT
jgi:FkbM family methyltransferase